MWWSGLILWQSFQTNQHLNCFGSETYTRTISSSKNCWLWAQSWRKTHKQTSASCWRPSMLHSPAELWNDFNFCFMIISHFSMFSRLSWKLSWTAMLSSLSCTFVCKQKWWVGKRKKFEASHQRKSMLYYFPSAFGYLNCSLVMLVINRLTTFIHKTDMSISPWLNLVKLVEKSPALKTFHKQKFSKWHFNNLKQVNSVSYPYL